MAWTTIAAVYFVVWWVVLFAVLPFGVRPQDEADIVAGTDPGAPAATGLKWKLIWTTLISGVVLGLFYAGYVAIVKYHY